MTASTGLQSLRAAGRDIAFRIDGEAGLPWLVAALVPALVYAGLLENAA